jgi:hypothetical protein
VYLLCGVDPMVPVLKNGKLDSKDPYATFKPQLKEP